MQNVKTDVSVVHRGEDRALATRARAQGMTHVFLPIKFLKTHD